MDIFSDSALYSSLTENRRRLYNETRLCAVAKGGGVSVPTDIFSFPAEWRSD